MSRSIRHLAILSVCLDLCIAGCNNQGQPAGQTATPVAGSATAETTRFMAGQAAAAPVTQAPPQADKPIANQAAAPAQHAARGAANEAAPTAEEILSRLDEFYRKADGLTFDFSQTALVNLAGAKNEMTTEMVIAAARPNLLAMRTQSGLNKVEIVCDGEHLYLSAPALGRYVKSSAPATFDELIADPQFMMLNMLSGKGPFLELLASQPRVKLMEGVTSAKYLGQDTLDVQVAHHLGFEQPEFNWELWVAATGDPVVLKASMDMGKAMAQAGQGFGDMKMNIVQSYKNWRFGRPSAADAFAFSPPANAKEAASLFDMPLLGQQGEASPLIGKPAKKGSATQPEGLEVAWSVEGSYTGLASEGNTVFALRRGGQCDVVDSSGQVIRTFKLAADGILLRFAKLTGASKGELLVFGPWGPSVSAVRNDGSRLWAEIGGQGIDDVSAADLDGDGKDEVIIGYNGSTGLLVLGGDGQRRWANTEIANVWHVASGDVNGDGKPEVVSTSAAGVVHVFDGAGKSIATIQPGVYANMVRSFRRQKQDDADAVLIADGGPAGARLVAFSGQGQKLWNCELPGNALSVDSLAVAPTAPWAAAGLRGGVICVVNLDDGRLIAQAAEQGATPQVGWLSAQATSPPILVVAAGRALTAMTVKAQAK